VSARERRQGDAVGAQLRKGLTSQQLATLETMQQFGWVLQFVRRPLFQPPIPVVFDRKRERYAVVEADGTINENPGFRIRS
jgi:hypothetical protein